MPRSQTKYKKTLSSSVNEDDIQAVGNQLEQLMKSRGGELTPHDVIKEATVGFYLI